GYPREGSAEAPRPDSAQALRPRGRSRALRRLHVLGRRRLHHRLRAIDQRRPADVIEPRRARPRSATIHSGRAERDRGAPRFTRGAPSETEERHDSLGARRARPRSATIHSGRAERWGVWGAMSGPPIFIDTRDRRGARDSIAPGTPTTPTRGSPRTARRGSRAPRGPRLRG